jgi:hypothetical protein
MISVSFLIEFGSTESISANVVSCWLKWPVTRNLVVAFVPEVAPSMRLRLSHPRIEVEPSY